LPLKGKKYNAWSSDFSFAENPGGGGGCTMAVVLILLYAFTSKIMGCQGAIRNSGIAWKPEIWKIWKIRFSYVCYTLALDKSIL